MDKARKQTEEQLRIMERRIKTEYTRARDELTKRFTDFMNTQGAYVNDLQNEYEDLKMMGFNAEARKVGEELGKQKRKLTIYNEKYKEMIDYTTDRLANINQAALDYINGRIPKVYITNYNQMKEDCSKIRVSFSLVDEHTIARRIKDGEIRLPKKKISIPKDKRWNKKNLNSAVIQGILQGESMDDIAKRIYPIVDYNRKAAIRNARTMVTSAENQGRLDSYKSANDKGIVTRKKWIATEDSRTRISHLHLNGEVVDVDKEFSNGLMYPADPNGIGKEVYNCRCTMVSEIVGFKKADGTIEYVGEEPQYEIEDLQSLIGRANNVEEVNSIMNNQGWFKGSSKADLTGCDLDSAKSIVSSYQQVFEKYPKLVGRFNAPNAHPSGMKDSTYAWCYIRTGGQVQVNPKKFNNWKSLSEQYEKDVIDGYHPYGTTAESIVTHEIGHAIDGLLAEEGILGGYTAGGEFRYASSSLRNTILKRAAKEDEIIGGRFEIWGWDKETTTGVVREWVSEYATKSNQEWFAECFAEYITSANPRTIATEFGKELEKLLGRLK